MLPRAFVSIWSVAVLLALASAAGAEDAVKTDQSATVAPAPATTAAPTDAAVAPTPPAGPAAAPAAVVAPAAPAEPVMAPAAAAAQPATPAASPATATVIFFRPSKFMGAAVGFIVREGQTELGKLRSGTHFEIQVAPGKHVFTVHSEAKDELTMEADAGETYYFEGSIGVGVLVGHPHLAPSDQATYEGAKPKMKESTPLSK